MTKRYPRALVAATAFAVIGTAALAPLPAAVAGEAPAKMLLVFHSMYGVDGPFVGNAFPQRGIPGDELPWTVATANGWLDTDGHLTVQVKGVVFTDDKEVPPAMKLGKTFHLDSQLDRGITRDGQISSQRRVPFELEKPVSKTS